MGLLAAIAAPPAPAQSRPQVRIAGQLVAAFTHVNPVPRDSGLAELRIVQPLLTVQASAADGRLSLLATANLEGATLADGELTPGAWGEGFMDRRHPHTYAHELMLVFRTAPGQVRAATAVGRGFVPFGTDDPMSRPPLRYPVNHHFSQILERAVLQASAGAGPVSLELATFNGDEPERPDQWPNIDRFGDSWAARLTVAPQAGVAVQISRAKVHSPEHRLGAASDSWKWSASARWERPVGRTPVYGLVEWARTSELEGFFVFHSLLVEGAATLSRHRPYARLERTERPEEQRLLDPFRSQRPHLENSILGITRWTIATAGYTFAGPGRRVRLWPVVELSYARVTSVTGGSLFTPADFYGSSHIWSGTLGVRLDAGMTGHRMGRYGVNPRGAPPNEHQSH